MLSTYISEYQDHDELVTKVRRQFLELAEADPDSYDRCDIEKVKTSRFAVLRFLLQHHLDPDRSLRQLDESMKWRKTNDVNSLSLSQAPVEFFQTAALYKCGKDKLNYPVVYFRAKVVVKNQALEPIYKKLLIGMIKTLDDETYGRGYVNVLDMSGVSLINVDLTLIRYWIEILRRHFPKNQKLVIVYNLPWYLRSFLTIIKLWLSPEEKTMLQLATGDQLFQWIDRDQVPVMFGGDNREDIRKAPDGCKTVLQMCEEVGGDEAKCREYLELFREAIEEAEQLVKQPNI